MAKKEINDMKYKIGDKVRCINGVGTIVELGDEVLGNVWYLVMTEEFPDIGLEVCHSAKEQDLTLIVS